MLIIEFIRNWAFLCECFIFFLLICIGITNLKTYLVNKFKEWKKKHDYLKEKNIPMLNQKKLYDILSNKLIHFCNKNNFKYTPNTNLYSLQYRFLFTDFIQTDVMKICISNHINILPTKELSCNIKNGFYIIGFCKYSNDYIFIIRISDVNEIDNFLNSKLINTIKTIDIEYNSKFEAINKQYKNLSKLYKINLQDEDNGLNKGNMDYE